MLLRLARRAVLAAAALTYAATALLAVSFAASSTTAEASDAPGGHTDARFYRSGVTAVEPAVAGLTITLTGNGDSITLENRTGRTVVVLGYAGEPFLRFSGAMVERNALSLTTALTTGQKPPSVDPRRTAPAWQHLGHQPVFAWRDVRVHWTATQRPPVVEQDEHARHRVFEWALPLTVDGRAARVRGAVDWVGTPAPDHGGLVTGVLVVGVVVAAAGLAVAGGLAVTRRRRRRPAVEGDRRPAPGPGTGPRPADGTTGTDADRPAVPGLVLTGANPRGSYPSYGPLLLPSPYSGTTTGSGPTETPAPSRRRHRRTH